MSLDESLKRTRKLAADVRKLATDLGGLPYAFMSELADELALVTNKLIMIEARLWGPPIKGREVRKPVRKPDRRAQARRRDDKRKDRLR